MVYIIKSDENDKEKSFKKKVYEMFSRKKYHIKIDHYDGHVLITLNDINRQSLKKLTNFFQLNCTRLVCISEELRKNQKFIEYLKEQDVSFFQGNWLYKYILLNLIEYIVKNKDERLELQDVSILINDVSESLIYAIKEIALKVKELNIVTNNTRFFSKVEKELYYNHGIILNISNNYSKSLRKSNIIINYDFLEEEINKYVINKTACLININHKVKINSKSFSGLNINSYNINLPNKYEYGEWQKNFNTAIFYESLIYKNTSAKNIIQELQKDHFTIHSLNGINGVIRKNEYLKIAKKV